MTEFPSSQEFENFFTGGLATVGFANYIKGLGKAPNTQEGAGDESQQYGGYLPASYAPGTKGAQPNIGADAFAPPATAPPALGGINPLYILGGVGLIAVLALRR